MLNSMDGKRLLGTLRSTTVPTTKQNHRRKKGGGEKEDDDEAIYSVYILMMQWKGELHLIGSIANKYACLPS